MLCHSLFHRIYTIYGIGNLKELGTFMLFPPPPTLHIGSDVMLFFLISVHFLVQVAGNFHIAPGRSFQQHHVHGQANCNQ